MAFISNVEELQALLNSCSSSQIIMRINKPTFAYKFAQFYRKNPLTSYYKNTKQ